MQAAKDFEPRASQGQFVIGQGAIDKLLDEAAIFSLVTQAFDAAKLDRKRVLVIIPDGTRTAPISLFFRLINQALLDRVAALDYLVALGTHPPMNNRAIAHLLDVSASARARYYPKIQVFQHHCKDPKALANIGILKAAEVAAITGNRITIDVPIEINKKLLEYDQIIICGPVFPHEAAGFSGGNKYLFPGVSGTKMIDLIHWLGALETNLKVIGHKSTVTRQVIEEAAARVEKPKLAICLVTQNEGLAGLYIGDPLTAWSKAANISAQVHVRYVDRCFHQVLAVIPSMYTDMWTTAKGVLKVEPVVEDGGEIILYAPHIQEITYSHGDLVDQIGYHVRDYYLAQWERFRHIPGRVLSHSTLIRGTGTFIDGVENARIQVTLATRIPKERCERLNLGYRNPETIDLAAWAGREQEGILLVPQAGEILYRVRKGNDI